MAIGNWGTDIVFRVSEREALLLQSLNRTVSAEWAAHSRIGLKNQSEFIRPGLQQVTFTMVLDATLGIRPRAEHRAAGDPGWSGGPGNNPWSLEAGGWADTAGRSTAQARHGTRS